MSSDRSSDRFPVGASIGVEDLRHRPYASLARLRAAEPVSWLPALGAWFITSRDLAMLAMRDAATFTVDDPRFSTAAVLGESMLSLEGPDHERHRQAFADPFRANVVREQFEDQLVEQARAIVTSFARDKSAELRTSLAGPLAVGTITTFLGLGGVDPVQVLDWYHHIADAIVGTALGRAVPLRAQEAIDQIHEQVSLTRDAGTSPLIRAVDADGLLRPEELAPATAVVMFGAIETSEGMTANVLWHLLSRPKTLRRVIADRLLLPKAIEESLRLEPAAAVIDRYTTADVEIGGVTIPERDMVTISLLGANRDPAVFVAPDRYDIDRPNLTKHVTFVHGPHGCLGLHLARMETIAAVDAVLDLLPGIRLDRSASQGPEGLIFRKPAAVTARWD